MFNKHRNLLLLCLLILGIGCGSGDPVSAPEIAPTERLLSGISDYNQLIETHATDVILVNFWAAGCNACRYEIPVINQLHETFDSRVTILAINVDRVESLTQARNYAINLGLDMDIYVDQNLNVFSGLDLHVFPTTVIYSRDKNIVPEILPGVIEFESTRGTLEELLSR